MTPQTHPLPTRRAALGLMASAVAAAGSLGIAGCDPRTLMYFLQPDGVEIPAPGPDLKEKKVVVLTTASPTASSDYQNIDREITREVINLLREKVKKIEIVPTEKVAAWVEAHPTWSDRGEIIKAFEADAIIYFEIQSFSIEDPRSPGMLEGNAEINIRVSEHGHPKTSKGKVMKSAPKETKETYSEDWKTTFPRNAPISLDQGVSKPVFKSKFVKIVSSELSWQFTGHNHGDDIQDSKFASR